MEAGPQGSRVWRVLLALLLSALLGPGGVARADEVSLLITADTRGHLEPCRTCGEAVALGGLARRATAVSDHRRDHAHVLLLDAGNMLFGSPDARDEGESVARAYGTMGYDVVNVSYHDLRLGAEHALGLLEAAGLSGVSANLADRTTGDLLLQPYAVREVGGLRIAVLGVAEAPGALEFLPHLRQQSEDIEVRPPVDALAAHLPAVRDRADRVVLLYAGSSRGLVPIIERHGRWIDAVVAAGLRADQWPERDEGPPVVTVFPYGQALGRVALTSDAPARVMEPLLLGPDHQDAPDVARQLAPYRVPPVDLSAELLAQAREAARLALPDRPEPDRLYRLHGRWSNRGARVQVLGAGLFHRFGDVAAEPGRSLLVVRTRWENIIPLQIVDQQALGTEYRVGNLGDHLYALADGRMVGRLRPDADRLPGHVPVRPLALEHIGSRREGHVIFDLPAEEVRSLELRFYDFAHGHAQFPLIPVPEEWQPDEPVLPVEVNEIVEAAVYDVQVTETLEGRRAPEGMAFLTVDLRARSMFSFEADATAFDPQAEAGQKMSIGTVADWLEGHKYLHAVVDGEYAYAPDPDATTLPAEPRFLPDLMTGGRVVFPVPAEFESLALRGDFPNARMPDGTVIRPRPIRMALRGEPAELPEREGLWSVRDDTLEVAITDRRAAPSFAGVAAEAGRQFLVLDVTVRNIGEKPEFFQTLEQLRHVDERGRQTPPHPATFDGLYRPVEHVWVPDGEQRTFQVAYTVAEEERRPRVSYRGFTLAETVELPPLEEPVRVAEVTPGPDEPAPPPPAEEPEDVPPPALPEPPAPPEPPEPSEPVRPEREPQGLAGVGLSPEQVNEAIDRGADFLWEHLSEDRLFRAWQAGRGSQASHGDTYALALLHAHLHERSPEFDAAVRSRLDNMDLSDVGWRRRTYEMAVISMLIESYGDPLYLPKLRDAARWLVEAQGPLGFWAYVADVPEELYLREAPEPSPLYVSGGRSLDELDAPAERWERITDWDVGGDKDLSVAQFALLGLHSVERAGTFMPEVLWRRTLQGHVDAQHDDGGWGYTPGSRRRAYGSMTCAGICAIAIAQHALGERDPAGQEAIERGLAWLDRHFAVDEVPPGDVRVAVGGQWLYYYLYSLERVGRILDTEFIGEHEWYPLGARFLVDTQRPDGSWAPEGERPEELATAFALLFLTRATPTLEDAVVLERGGDGTLATSVVRPAPRRVYIMLDASGSLLEPYQDGIVFDQLREAVRTVVRSLPPGTEVALRVFGHQYRAIEPEADEDTKLEIPMVPLDLEQFEAKLDEINPRGKTPLALTLREAAGDLSRVRRRAERPVLVLLVADGEENTRPRQDPLAGARELAQVDDLDFHVIGFDVDMPEHAEQLRAIADILDASYQMADEPYEIAARLDAIFRPAPPEFRVLDREGEEVVVEGVRLGESVVLPEGKYVLRTRDGARPVEASFWINTNRTTDVRFTATELFDPEHAPPMADVPPTREVEEAAPELPARFCTQCGDGLTEGARFCTACGAPVP